MRLWIRKCSDAPIVGALETRGKLNDGRTIPYALGLVVQDHKGIKEVSHSGSTAGYQTFLARYPEKKLSIALLCNGSSPGGVAIGGSIVDEIFGPFPEPQKSVDTASTGIEQLNKYVGLAANEKTHFPARITYENGALRVAGQAIRAIADGTFLIGADEVKFSYDKDGRPIAGEGRGPTGGIMRFVAEREWTPVADELKQFTGEWFSEEAQAKFTFAVEDGKPLIKQPPTTKLPLRRSTKTISQPKDTLFG